MISSLAKSSEPESSNIYLYGSGVFTTIPLVDSHPLLWERHWLRLTSNAERLGIDISKYSEDSVRAAVMDRVSKHKLVSGRIRVSLIDESPGELWSAGKICVVSLSILIGERRRPPSDLKLTVSPHCVNTTSPLTGVKSCNYLEPLMSLREAKERGFHEAIRLNERGEVASASMANVFWVGGGRLFTPSLKTGSLAGTTREFILENLECEEVEAGINALRTAEEIFLTSAGIGVAQVAEFEGRELKRGNHAITRLLPF